MFARRSLCSDCSDGILRLHSDATPCLSPDIPGSLSDGAADRRIPFGESVATGNHGTAAYRSGPGGASGQ